MTFTVPSAIYPEEEAVVEGVGAVFAKQLRTFASEVRDLFRLYAGTFRSRTVDVKGGATPADSATEFLWNVGNDVRPQHIIVTRVTDTKNAPVATTGAVFLNWYWDGKSVRITQVFGLTSGASYRLRLVILGELNG